LDPETTTFDEIERLNPVFECLHCHSISEGRCLMDWTAIVSYPFNLLQNSTHLLTIIIDYSYWRMSPRPRSRWCGRILGCCRWWRNAHYCSKAPSWGERQGMLYWSPSLELEQQGGYDVMHRVELRKARPSHGPQATHSARVSFTSIVPCTIITHRLL